MSRVVWQSGRVISVGTRKGLFVLAQMSKEPYLVFFNAFRSADDWTGADASALPVLFCCGVTRHFLKNSRVRTVKDVPPADVRALPARWIRPATLHSRKVKAWAGTPEEREFATIGEGGALVEMDILGHKGGPYRDRSGAFDRMVIPSISPGNAATIDGHETTGLGVFPGLNERLHLCHRAGKNVDPEKDILFNRPMPPEYAVYLDVTRACGKRSAEELLALYERP